MYSIKEEARKILTPDDIEYLNQIKYVSGIIKNHQLQLEYMDKEIKHKEAYKKKTYQNYMDELISKEEYKSYAGEFETDIHNLKEKAEKLREEIREQDRLGLEYDEWMEKFKNYIDVDELTREMVLELIERIEVNEDGSIGICYKFRNPMHGAY